MQPGEPTRPVPASDSTHARGPLPAWLSPLGVVLEPVYRWEIARRNRAFDAGRGVVALDRPVISVGNLSVGGTGKSPMVARVVRMLIAMGHSPCIAMRGYGAKRGGRSDEEDAYLRQFPSVPVVARPDRVEGLLDLFAEEAKQDVASSGQDSLNSPRQSELGEPDGDAREDASNGPAMRSDVVVLDDGFQHRRLARDLDIVMIDVTRSPFEDRLLPRGWLREPVESTARAGLVVLTHADGAATSTIEKQLRPINASLSILRGEHAWAGLLWRDAGNVDDREVAAAALSGRRVMVCCAIGNPQRFVAMVQRAAGVPPCDVLTLRDHDAYEPATIAMVLDRARAAHADVIMVTDKDWSKLRRVRPEAWPCAVARPRLELNLSDDAAFDRALRESIERHRESMRSE